MVQMVRGDEPGEEIVEVSIAVLARCPDSRDPEERRWGMQPDNFLNVDTAEWLGQTLLDMVAAARSDTGPCCPRCHHQLETT
jgi:hypothetical protein